MTLTQKEIEKNRKMFSGGDKNMVAVFKILSDINRYRIFRILVERPRISVSNLAKILEISSPLASQHIKILEHAHIVEKERAGKRVFPKLAEDNPSVCVLVKIVELAILLDKKTHDRR